MTPLVIVSLVKRLSVRTTQPRELVSAQSTKNKFNLRQIKIWIICRNWKKNGYEIKYVIKYIASALLTTKCVHNLMIITIITTNSISVVVLSTFTWLVTEILLLPLLNKFSQIRGFNKLPKKMVISAKS